MFFLKPRRYVLQGFLKTVVIRTIAKHGKEKVNRAVSLAVAALVIGLGFVSAAILYTADHVIRGRPGLIMFGSPSGWQMIRMFFFCMFAGPYFTAERGLVFWSEGRIDTPILALCGLVSLLWSFCAGVFVAQLLMLIGIIQV